MSCPLLCLECVNADKCLTCSAKTYQLVLSTSTSCVIQCPLYSRTWGFYLDPLLPFGSCISEAECESQLFDPVLRVCCRAAVPSSAPKCLPRLRNATLSKTLNQNQGVLRFERFLKVGSLPSAFRFTLKDLDSSLYTIRIGNLYQFRPGDGMYTGFFIETDLQVSVKLPVL